MIKAIFTSKMSDYKIVDVILKITYISHIYLYMYTGYHKLKMLLSTKLSNLIVQVYLGIKINK